MISIFRKNKNNCTSTPEQMLDEHVKTSRSATAGNGSATESDMTSTVGKGSASEGNAWLRDLRYGRSLSLDLFRRNAWILLLILVVTIALMGLRYKTKTKMLEIKRLEKQLNQAESEKLREKGEYMSLIRETEMERLVNEKGLGLVFQEQPPYEVTAVKE